MKCSNCGSNIPANAKFCGVCGTAVIATSAESIAETVALDTSNSPEIQAAAAALEAASDKSETATETPVAATTEAPKSTEASTEETTQAPTIEVGSSKPSEDTPSVAKAAPSSTKQAAAESNSPGGEKKKGKFRETIWFMQADDPEMMSSIENENLEEREATYQDPGGRLDDRSREKFSLNISESAIMKAVERDAIEGDVPPESTKSWFYASVVIGSIVLAAGVYFIFFAK